jgi:hypothetical protein
VQLQPQFCFSSSNISCPRFRLADISHRTPGISLSKLTFSSLRYQQCAARR